MFWPLIGQFWKKWVTFCYSLRSHWWGYAGGDHLKLVFDLSSGGSSRDDSPRDAGPREHVRAEDGQRTRGGVRGGG